MKKKNMNDKLIKDIAYRERPLSGVLSDVRLDDMLLAALAAELARVDLQRGRLDMTSYDTRTRQKRSTKFHFLLFHFPSVTNA